MLLGYKITQSNKQALKKKLFLVFFSFLFKKGHPQKGKVGTEEGKKQLEMEKLNLKGREW